jgi:hypothetical protein
MQLLYQAVVLGHLVGFASLLGGVLVQARNRHPEVSAAMLHGALTMLATGLILVALLLVTGEPLPYGRLAVKLAVTAAVTLLVVKNRKFVSIPRGLWGLIGGLTVANAGVAVLWT